MSGNRGPDLTVERMKTARQSVVVLKLQFVLVRSRCGSVPVVVVEGTEDKPVYSTWLERIRPNFTYEFFVAQGKGNVLALRAVLLRDASGLGQGVSFFVDRDFDDLRGEPPSPNLFMTDRYSIENYLADPTILEKILTIELHCHGNPQVRERVIALYESTYARFLEVTKEFNRRHFFAKKLSIKLIGSLPEKIGLIAIVKLDDVESQVRAATDVVRLEREPTDEETALYRLEFETLEPALRYRGKYASLFFYRWLGLLVEDYRAMNTVHFAEIDRATRARAEDVVSSSLAQKSPLPTGLSDFVKAM